jgi:hypothetical protein
VKYTPNADFNGLDTFTYTNADGETATVTVDVNAVADTPDVTFSPDQVNVSVTPQSISQTIGAVVGDEAGDDNIGGSGISYVDGTTAELDFGSLFADVTVHVVFDVTINGSWNFDGASGNYDDYWEVQADGSPVARFFYNANITEDFNPDRTTPTGDAEGSPNELGGGDNYSYGSPQSSENSNMNYTHDTPEVAVTLDSDGKAVLQFAGSTTSTTETATINSATVAFDEYTYDIPFSASLVDLDASEALSLTLAGVPTGASLGDIAISNGYTLNELTPGEYAIEGGDGQTADTMLSLTVLAPKDIPPVFDLSLEAVATESDGSTASRSVTIGIDGTTVAPVAIDLHNDGIEYLARDAGVVFEDQATGEAMATAWVGSDDGLLVIDENRSGTVDGVHEYVFTRWSETAETDMQAIAEVFDTDGNQILDANDEAWEQFAVWQDADSDGTTDAGEMRSLDDLGIKSISLDYNDGSRSGVEADGDVVVHGQSDVTWTDGSVTTAEDASFAVNSLDGGNDGMADDLLVHDDIPSAIGPSYGSGALFIAADNPGSVSLASGTRDLSISAEDVLTFADASDTLFVDGDNSNSLSLDAGSLQLAPDQSVAPEGYRLYEGLGSEFENVKLFVADEVAVV